MDERVTRESPFLRHLAALADDPHLKNGLNVAFGKVTCEPVAEALGYPYVDPAQVMG